MSTIDFIGGEKGGVGKSVVARLVAQYAIDRGFPFTALDADSSHGTLRRHYADHARAIDLSSFESADAIMALATEADLRVVVDLIGIEAARDLMKRVDVSKPAGIATVKVVPEQVMVSSVKN